MKIFNYTAVLILILGQLLMSCSKDDTGAKVGVEPSKLTLNDSDSSNIFTIINIETEIDGDTSTILIESANKDSSIYFYIGFENVVNFGEKVYELTDSETSTETRCFAYMRMGTGAALQTIYFESGKITILDYLRGSEIQGKFELKITPEDSGVFKGEFYASYLMIDPNRLPDLPINPRTMEVNINTLKTLFNANASTTGSEKGYVVNGILGNDMVVTISFKYFVPEINKIYKIGDEIVIDNDPTTSADNDTGYVEASFFDKGISYIANEEKGSGKFVVTKLSSSTIQGTFDFKGIYQKKDSLKTIDLTEGMFYAKLKIY